MPSGKPALNSSEWFSGTNKPPVLLNLRPEGMTSVYEIKEEEGGRSRFKDEARKKATPNTSAEPRTSGSVSMLVQGYIWNSWEKYEIL